MPRRPRLRELAAALAVAALAGCGGSSGGDVLADSAHALDGVHSGVLSLKVTLTPSGGAGRQPFGFELRGPFALGDRTLARMTYTQIANGHRGVARLVLGAQGGYVESNGTRRALTAPELARLRGTARAAAAGGGLRLDEWATSRHERRCGDAICVDGDLDPVKALQGIAQLQQQVAGPAEDAPALRRAVRTSRYELVAAKDGDVPRQLTLVIDFHKTVPPKLRHALGSYVGARLDFDFALARANEDVGLR